jgi:hypothetical protein
MSEDDLKNTTGSAGTDNTNTNANPNTATSTNNSSSNVGNHMPLKPIIIVAALILIALVAAFVINGMSKKSTVSCDSESAVNLLRATLKEHPNWVYNQYSFDVKKPFTIGAITKFAPDNETLQKSYCEALINSSISVKYILQRTVSGSDFTITILSNY